MPFKPVILATDALIWLLVIAVLAFAWYVRRREHLLAPWQRVAGSASGMAAATALSFFVIVGLLDSVHFRPALPDEPGKPRAYAVAELSLLDMALKPLRTREERTYSAPLATHLFSKETVELPDGSMAREYPRLRFGAAGLRDPQQDWLPDVLRRAGLGLAGATLAWAAAAAGLVAVLARRRAAPAAVWREVW